MVKVNAGMHMLFEDCSGVLARIMEESTKFAVFCHYADNAQRKHVHFYIEYEGSESRIKTWKNWIKEIWNPGRNDWWFPTQQKGSNLPVDENVIVYMTKGKYKSVMTKGFSEEDIAGFSAKWKPKPIELIRESVNVAVEERSRSKAKTQWQIQEEAIEILHDKYDTDAEAFKEVVNRIPPVEIYRAVRFVLHKNQRKISDRLAIDLIQSIQSYGSKQEDRIANIFSKW